MSESETKEPEERTPIKRASEAKRAYRIRKKPEDERTEDEKEWYANYMATKVRQRRTVPDNAEPAVEEPGQTDTDAPPVESESAPPPPPPPKVDTAPKGDSDADARAQSATSNWRAKYQRGGKASGREQTVLFVASQWHAVNKFMADQIKLSGSKPIVDPDIIFNALVLTVDDYMPQELAIKPVHIAAFGTSALLVQRVIRHKKVGEAIKDGTTMEDIKKEEPPPPPPHRPQPVTQEPVTQEPITQEPEKPMEPIVNLTPDAPVEYKPGSADVF
jgi:hypothetical protein